MKIIISAKLKDSQIKYKIIPLSKSDGVDEIYLLRKTVGPEIPKVHYIILPKATEIRILNILITPILLAFYTLKFKIDLIVSYNFLPHGFFAFVASKLTNTPFNYSQIDTNTIEMVKKGGLKGQIIRFMIKQALFINVPGSNSESFWVEQGIQRQRIRKLHSTIDTNKEFLPRKSKKVFDLLYIGVLEPRKQVNVIVDAFAMLKAKYPELTMAIVGNGSLTNEIEKQIADLGLSNSIYMFGHRNQIKSFIHLSKIFVMASKIEGIPCAMMEAMACELYPIVPDIADIADVVSETTGTLLPNTFDTSDLAAAIDTALFNWNNNESIRKAARRNIVKFHSYTSATHSWNEIISNFFNITAYENETWGFSN